MGGGMALTRCYLNPLTRRVAFSNMEHVIGGIGTILVLAAYFLVSTGRVTSGSIGFQGMNLVGAILLTIYGFLLFAWATVALNGIWGIIAIVALARVLRGRSKRKSSSSSLN